MERREAVKFITMLMGGTAIVGGSAFISGCKSDTGKDLVFSTDEISFLNEIANVIIPDTDTPGAKAANVGEFMMRMVNDTYEAKNQTAFLEGMHLLNDRAKITYEKPFVKLKDEEKFEMLEQLDAEQEEYTKSKLREEPPHYFRMMKELTLLGYFTSEIGVTQARRYAPVPGRFDACIPYNPGDKAWVY